MSTRGFLGFRKDGQVRITYNHSDSYPSWLGDKLITYVRENDMDSDARDWFDLTLVDEGDTPTDADWDRLVERGASSLRNRTVSTGQDWYATLREAQGDPKAYLLAGFLPEKSSAALTENDIFMEWGYVIDVDAKALVIYEGQAGGGLKDVSTLTFDEARAPLFNQDEYIALLEKQDED